MALQSGACGSGPFEQRDCFLRKRLVLWIRVHTFYIHTALCCVGTDVELNCPVRLKCSRINSFKINFVSEYAILLNL